MLDQETVRGLLDYDPDTGALTWREREVKWFASRWAWLVWNKRFAGKPATAAMNKGYRQIRILGKNYLGHRVIWLWMTGDWPDGVVDHQNHDKTDNRWGNLRSVTHAENSRNRAAANSNEVDQFGVRWVQQRKRWVARLGSKYLGRFKEKADAIAARKHAEELHGYHQNHGRFMPPRAY